MKNRAFFLISFMLGAFLLVSCGGDNGLNDNDTYNTGDLEGEWNFQQGQPLVDSGNFTFDSDGNLTGVTPPAGSSNEILAFGGQLSVNDLQEVTGILNITTLVKTEGQDDQVITEELSFTAGGFINANSITGLVGNIAVENPQSVPYSLSKL